MPHFGQCVAYRRELIDRPAPPGEAGARVQANIPARFQIIQREEILKRLSFFFIHRKFQILSLGRDAEQFYQT